MQKTRSIILTIGFIATAALVAKPPPPAETNKPSAEFKVTHEASPPSEHLTLRYGQPANEWTEALPIGNGRLGAMVYGGVEREHLQLNEDTLWSGGPHSYDNPDAWQHLATAREAIEDGRYKEAEGIAQKMLGRHKYQQAYMPFGDLFLEFPKGDDPQDYRRRLNLQTAVAEVSYRIGEARFTRKVIASRPDEGIVIRLECDQLQELPGHQRRFHRVGREGPCSNLREILEADLPGPCC